MTVSRALLAFEVPRETLLHCWHQILLADELMMPLELGASLTHEVKRSE